jgi:transcriptional regulator with XRE-family HTH domain
MKTIGQNIARLRKEKGITQEQLAEICNVSPQAVSKWENDNSCPDVTLLKLLARTFGVSVDELLDDGEGPITKLAEVDGAKAKLLKIRVLDDGNKVTVNLPVALFELLLMNNEIKDKIKIGNSNTVNSIDFEEIMRLISLGVMGKLVEVEGADGEIVEIWVE